MPKDYKLCPKCSNALDNNVMQCPYCGESLWINFWAWISDNSWFNKEKVPSTDKKKSWCWCWCWCLFLLILFVIPIVWGIISSLLDELDWEELSELKEIVTQELGDMLGIEDSDINYSNEAVVQEENVQRVLNSDEMLAIDAFNEIFEAIGNLDYPKYQNKEGWDVELWDVELSTSTSEDINNLRKNIVILKYKWSEFKRYFLQLDEKSLEFFFDDENNNIHRVTENEVLEDILPIFRESLNEAGR